MFTKEKTNTCKGIAILLLIFHHLFRSEEAIIPHDMCFFVLPHNIVPGIASCARVCVYMFVFLSAYGLMYKYSHLPEEKKAHIYCGSMVLFDETFLVYFYH